MTAEELAAAARSGDAQAMAELWKRMERLSRASARRYVVFAHMDGAVDEEDVCQVGALAFLEFVQRYDPAMGCGFAAGLYRFTGWRIMRAFDPRRDHSEALPRFVSLDEPLPCPDGGEELTLADVLEDEAAREPFERLEPMTDLARAVEALPEDQRRVIRLRYREERSWRKVGEALGLDADAVRNLGARATAALRRDRSLRDYRPGTAADWRHVTLAEYRLTGVSAVEKAVERMPAGFDAAADPW